MISSLEIIQNNNLINGSKNLHEKSEKNILLNYSDDKTKKDKKNNINESIISKEIKESIEVK